MVLLTVKGTKHADEFTYECSVKDLAGDVAPKVAQIQNKRLSVKNQLSSARELLDSARIAVAMEGRPTSDAKLAKELEDSIATITADLANARAAVAPGKYDGYWNTLRDLLVAIFPNECTHVDDKDKGKGYHEAAITNLYHLYENPDIDEDYRLMVYHCRCIMDPLWRIHDMVDEKKTVGLWFNGKEMAADAPVGTVCSNNEKSRITVKVALSGGVAPSLEPRIDYAHQRELRSLHAARAEERKQLEESELHAIIKQRYAGNPAAAIGAIASASVAASRSAQPPSIKGGKVSETIVSGN